MIPGVQQLALDMGRWACFEYSIMKAAELERKGRLLLADTIGIHVEARRLGYVDAECTVGPAGDMMGWLVGDGSQWICLKAGTGRDSAGRPYDLPLDYQLRPGEYDIHRYEHEIDDGPGVKHTSSHFFLAAPELYDSVGQSLTRLNGHLVSRRILRRRTP